jgi:hypothetical protein
MDNLSPITTLGGILESLLAHEQKEIAKFEDEHGKISHGPTIGDIYEGLTAKLIRKAIPAELNLRVTNGIISGKNGSKSGQIDCMLVKGAGFQIPNSDSEIIPIDNVLAVLEVKKNLYGGHFEDILDHFNQLMVLEPNSPRPIPEEIYRIFSQITGVYPRGRKEIESLEFHQQLVFHSLVSEHVRPVRIAIGYDGFKKESGLRNSFLKLMKAKTGNHWIPPTSWPDLLISGSFSMVKMNGRPYALPSRGGYWNLFATSRVRPVQLLLEFIYTMISKEVSLPSFWGEDLEQEVMNPFLDAKAVDFGEKKGWEYNYTQLEERDMSGGAVTNPWSPYFPDKEEAIVFHMLMNSPEGLDIAEIEKGLGQEAEPLVQKLTKTGLVARNGRMLFLTTIEAKIGFLGDGRCFVGEDDTGKLQRWAIKEIERLRANK